MKKILRPKKIKFLKHNDSRGYLLEMYNKKKINLKFERSIISMSKKNVIRGMHVSRKPEYRLIYVLKGEINDFAFNFLNHKKIIKFNLKKNEGLLLPPTFVHGYECLGKENIVIYFLSWPYKKENNLGINYNDKLLNIKWSIKSPIISKNDKVLPSYLEFKKKCKIK